MRKYLLALMGLLAFITTAFADNVLVVDPGYGGVAANVQNRLEAAGHTVTLTSAAPTSLTGYQQVWDLRYATALTSAETTLYSTFITNGGFAYFVTENPGCCMDRNNSVAALVTALGGGSTQIGPGWATNVETNMNTTYMTNGITVNYAAVAAIVNSQGIPLISDSSGAVSGMSWIGRAGALGSGVTGTIVTVADINWIDSTRMVVGGTTAQQQNVQALDDIIRGIVAGTVAGTISANGNGAGATNGNSGSSTPTVVSTAAGTPTVTSSTSNGTPTSTDASTRGTTTTTSNAVLGATTTTTTRSDVAAKSGGNINVTRTTTLTGVTPRTTTFTATTPITTVTTTVTPRTTTTTTVPVTITTYSDNSTTSTDGTPVVTTSTQNITTTSTTTANEVVVTNVHDTITQTASSNQSASVSAVGLKDAMAVRNFNPFLVDVISTKDGAWVTPLVGYTKTTGKIDNSSIGFGAQKTIENNTFGVAGTFGKSDSSGFLNSTSSSNLYGATIYGMNKQNLIWTKLAAGFSVSEYSTTSSLPIFALTNSSKVKVKNYYADLTLYSGKEFIGLRPLIGVTLNKSGVSSQVEIGSPLLSTLPEKSSSFEARPYAGVRYDISWFGIETRVTQSKDFNTVGQVRATVNKEVFRNVFFDVAGGFDKSSNYTAAVGMVGLKINF